MSRRKHNMAKVLRFEKVWNLRFHVVPFDLCAEEGELGAPVVSLEQYLVRYVHDCVRSQDLSVPFFD